MDAKDAPSRICVNSAESVECLLGALKTRGLRLGTTHITLHDHVVRFLNLLTLTRVWCVLAGLLGERPPQRHGRRAWSVVALGVRALVRSISRKADRDHEEVLTPIRRLELSRTA